MMMGTPLRARRRRHTSKPSMSGSMRSSRTQSAARRSKAVSAACAVGGFVDLVAVVAQKGRRLRSDGRVVFDEEDASGHSDHDAHPRGDQPSNRR